MVRCIKTKQVLKDQGDNLDRPMTLSPAAQNDAGTLPMQKTSARVLSISTAWNLASYVIPLVVGIFTIPRLISGLGTDRFGILALAWVLIGSFSLFDFGLGRALTQVVATTLGRGAQTELGPIVWSGLLLMLGCGLVGAGIMASVSPAAIHSWLRIPSSLQPDALEAFYVLASGLPLVVVTAGLRGVLEAQQRFGLSSAVRIPLGALTFGGPLMILPWTKSIAASVLVLLVGRAVAALAYLVICVRATPALASRPQIRLANMASVLRMGALISISNFVSPVIVYADRFVIGAILSIAAVAYYSVPYDLVVRILFIPGAIATVFFPAFAMSYANDAEYTDRLFLRASKYLLMLMFPILLVTIVLANQGLSLWVGSDFARQGTKVLQVLAIGVFANGLAQMPFAMIQAAGRADVTAKLHLVEAAIYLPVLWVLIAAGGIDGAAFAWTLRVLGDLLAQFLLTRRLVAGGLSRLNALLLPFAATLAALAIAMFLPSNLLLKVGFLVVALAAFATVGWFRLLSAEERAVAVRPFAIVRSAD
jgi:O-antigen/teichoic acid export membrane protein